METMKKCTSGCNNMTYQSPVLLVSVRAEFAFEPAAAAEAKFKCDIVVTEEEVFVGWLLKT